MPQESPDKIENPKSTIRYVDLIEFADRGYLQEMNRQFLHPLGMAAELTVGDDGKPIGGLKIWDYRDDPEGIVFTDLGDKDSADKANAVLDERNEKLAVRAILFGYAVQPIGHKMPDKDQK